MPDPIYTADNISVAYQLRWSLSVFWKQPAGDPAAWLSTLQQATEPDGVRILEHRLAKPHVSQFLVSTKPHVAPAQAIRSVKGRLQYLVRSSTPKALRRNYSIYSIGSAHREAVESYVASQLEHHRMADPRVEAMLGPYQFSAEGLELERPRRSSHGEFVYNLHLVAVHEHRFVEVAEESFRASYIMLQAAAKKRGHFLGGIGLLVDHIHWTVGCRIDEAPLDVGLSYLNNLAYAHGMRPRFQFGLYVGTFGPYDMNAVWRKLTPAEA